MTEETKLFAVPHPEADWISFREGFDLAKEHVRSLATIYGWAKPDENGKAKVRSRRIVKRGGKEVRQVSAFDIQREVAKLDRKKYGAKPIRESDDELTAERKHQAHMQLAAEEHHARMLEMERLTLERQQLEAKDTEAKRAAEALAEAWRREEREAEKDRKLQADLSFNMWMGLAAAFAPIGVGLMQVADALNEEKHQANKPTAEEQAAAERATAAVERGDQPSDADMLAAFRVATSRLAPSSTHAVEQRAPSNHVEADDE